MADSEPAILHFIISNLKSRFSKNTREPFTDFQHLTGAANGARTRDLRLGKPTLCQLSYCRNSIYNLSIYNLQFTKSEMLSNNLPDAKITLLTDYLAFADPIFSVPVAFALTRVKQCDPRSLQTPSFLSM